MATSRRISALSILRDFSPRQKIETAIGSYTRSILCDDPYSSSVSIE